MSAGMKFDEWLKSEVEYGRSLMHSAVEGARKGRDQALACQPVSEVLTRSARKSAACGALGASLGVIAVYMSVKHKPVRYAVGFGLLGAVIGFGGSMALSTRELTSGMARGAFTKMNTVRDAHWLARHPIDYA
jgi:hypothetical protein